MNPIHAKASDFNLATGSTIDVRYNPLLERVFSSYPGKPKRCEDGKQSNNERQNQHPHLNDRGVCVSDRKRDNFKSDSLLPESFEKLAKQQWNIRGHVFQHNIEEGLSYLKDQSDTNDAWNVKKIASQLTQRDKEALSREIESALIKLIRQNEEYKDPQGRSLAIWKEKPLHMVTADIVRAWLKTNAVRFNQK